MIDFDIPGPIGIQDIDVEQGFTKLKTNRTLVVANLQKEGPFEPDVVPDEFTGSLAKLFEYGKPKVSVTLETGNDDDPTKDEVIEYKSLKEFRPEELAKKVPLLKQLTEKERKFQKLATEIGRNKKMQSILADESKRKAFIEILTTIKEELEAVDAE